jgi:hypothetical protein
VSGLDRTRQLPDDRNDVGARRDWGDVAAALEHLEGGHERAPAVVGN